MDDWLGEVLQDVELADKAQLGDLFDALMLVQSHVATTLESGEDIDALIPEAGDADACHEWCRGYVALLGSVDPEGLPLDALESAVAIQALAGAPSFIEFLERSGGQKSREAVLTSCRESLGDDAHALYLTWAEARAQPRKTTVQRETAKVGRNDPCPCGSGKKYKKCCATA